MKHLLALLCLLFLVQTADAQSQAANWRARTLGQAAGKDTTASGRKGIKVRGAAGLSGTESEAVIVHEIFLPGDSVTVHIAELPTGGRFTADQGLWVGEDTTATAAFSALTFSKTGHLWPITRASNGASSVYHQSTGAVAPLYLKARYDTTAAGVPIVSLSYSQDGSSFQTLRTDTVSTWNTTGDTLYVARVASSYSDNDYAVAWFDDVQHSRYPPGLFLEDYPQTIAAFSLRKLRQSYTGPALRVHRTSDDAEQDIGFDVSGLVNTAALESFCTANSPTDTLRVDIWYNQIENGPNAAPHHEERRPYICAGGDILTDADGRVGMYFPKSDTVGESGMHSSLTVKGLTYDRHNMSMYILSSIESMRNRFTGRERPFDAGGYDYLVTTQQTGSWGHQQPSLRPTGPGEGMWVANDSFTETTGIFGDPILRVLRVTPDSTSYGENQYITYSRASAVSSNPGTEFTLGANSKEPRSGFGGFIQEVLLLPAVSPEDHVDIYLNRNEEWQMGSFYWYATNGMPQQRRQYEVILYGWLKQQTTEDFEVPTDTTITWDTTYANDQELADLLLDFHRDGDTRRAFNISARFHPGWYTLDDGGPAEPVTLLPVIDTHVSESSAGSNFATSADLEVKDVSGDRRWAYLQFDISGLTHEPVNAALRLNVELSSEDTQQPYIGAKVYTDLDWTEDGPTWSSPVVDLSTKPVYDDIEGISPAETLENVYISLFLDQQVMDAYNAGAQTVTVALYMVNDLYDGSSTARTISIHSGESAKSPELVIAQRRGMETAGNGQVYVPDQYDGVYAYNMSRNAAFWYNLDIPLANGGQGNPFYKHPGMGRRALALATAYGLLVPNRGATNWNWQDFLSGFAADAADSYDLAGELFPDSVQVAFEQLLLRYMKRAEQLGIRGANTNLDMKGVEAAGKICASARHMEEELCNQAERTMRRLVFGKANGTLTDFNLNKAAYWPEANIHEGKSPETSYNLRSMDHMLDGWVAVADKPQFDFMREVFERMSQFITYQTVRSSESGLLTGPSGYSGRTPDPIWRGQDRPWGNIVLATTFLEGRPIGQKAGFPETNAEMIDQIVTEMEHLGTYNYTATLPAFYKTYNSTWPSPIPYHPPSENWLSTFRSLYFPQDTTTLVYSERDTTYIKLFPSPEWGVDYPPSFLATRQCADNGECWSAFLEGQWYKGHYGSSAGGRIEYLARDSVDIMVLNRRVPANWDNQGYKHFGKDVHLTPVEMIWARRNDTTYTWASEKGSFTGDVNTRSVTWNPADSTYTIAARTSPTTTFVTSPWRHTRSMKIEDDGIRSYTTLTYDTSGVDTIDQMWYQLPLYVGERPDVAAALYYWTGGAWQRVTPGGNSFTADTLRWGRDLDGAGSAKDEEYIWYYFDQPHTFTMNTEHSVSNVRWNMLLLDLHGSPGTPMVIPESLSVGYKVSIVDPELVPTQSSIALLEPTEDKVLPEGGVMFGRFLIQWGASTPDTVIYQQKTTGGAWEDVGGMELDLQGTYYQWIGGTIPADLDSVRVKTIDTEAHETIRTFDVSSAPTTLVVADSFDVAVDTPIDASYELDLNLTGNTIDPFRKDVVAYAATGTITSLVSDSWGNQFRIDVGTNNHIARIRGNKGGNGHYPAPVSRHRSYYQHVRALFYSPKQNTDDAYVDLPGWGGADPVETYRDEFLYNRSDWFELQVQTVDNVVIGSMYDENGNLIGHTAAFDAQWTSFTTTGIWIGNPDNHVDWWTVRTWN